MDTPALFGSLLVAAVFLTGAIALKLYLFNRGGDK